MIRSAFFNLVHWSGLGNNSGPLDFLLVKGVSRRPLANRSQVFGNFADKLRLTHDRWWNWVPRSSGQTTIFCAAVADLTDYGHMPRDWPYIMESTNRPTGSRRVYARFKRQHSK
ncbi:hypothetical protein SprV_0200708400 [Sparganum proliferum]